MNHGFAQLNIVMRQYLRFDNRWVQVGGAGDNITDEATIDLLEEVLRLRNGMRKITTSVAEMGKEVLRGVCDQTFVQYVQDRVTKVVDDDEFESDMERTAALVAAFPGWEFLVDSKAGRIEVNCRPLSSIYAGSIEICVTREWHG